MSLSGRNQGIVGVAGSIAVLLCLLTPKAARAQDVTTADVKKFLDPTVMVNQVDYSFSANFVPVGIRAYAHKIGGFWAATSWTGFWANVPVIDYSLPEGNGPTGVGDLRLGWGVITHEDLDRRLTASALLVDVVAPTGDPSKGTGYGAWVLAPSGVFVFNPTDVFPVYIDVRYLHSFGKIGQIDGTDLHVRSLELSVQTVHIMPKGFFLVAIPTLTINFNQDFNVFSLAVGGGRAITPSFAWNAAYVQHLAGRETFNRAFTAQLQYIFGQRKDR